MNIFIFRIILSQYFGVLIKRFATCVIYVQGFYKVKLYLARRLFFLTKNKLYSSIVETL